MSELYKSLSDLPATVPVFPLAGAILLPRATLPLNIFEPRYLAMIEHALAGARMIAIVQPQGDGGPTGSPGDGSALLRTVACAGRLTAFQELDDGRMIITLTGIARCELVGEVTDASPFRRFDVSYARFAGDLIGGEGEEAVDREQLLEVLKAYIESRRLNANWQAILRLPTEQLVNSLAIASPFNPAERQALLEAPDLARRADILIALAQMELTASQGGSGPAPQSTLQ